MFLTTPISFGTFAFPQKISCKRRCARCMPRNRLEIGVPTFVSYRAGRCLTRLEVRLESSNVAVCDSTRCMWLKRRSARSLQRFLPKLVRTSLWAVFAAYRVFDPRFVSCWPMFADLSVVKRRCAPCLLKLRSRLRETRNRIQNNDPSRTICSILLF